MVLAIIIGIYMYMYVRIICMLHVCTCMLELFVCYMYVTCMYMYVRIICMVRVRVMVFNSNFSNISVISWRSVLLVEETEVPGKKPPTCRKSLTNFII